MAVVALPAELAPDGRPDSRSRGRVIDAALRCVARWGIAKTTLDDVAREAGCGRATVHRLFPGGREPLWDAVLVREAGRFFADLADAAGRAAALEDVLVHVLNRAACALRDHAALQFLLEHEPECVVARLAFHRGDEVLRIVSVEVAPLLVPWLDVADDSVAEAALRAAEWLARLVISYSTSPDRDVDLCDPLSARRLVQRYVLPGLQPATCLQYQSTS